MLNQLIFANKCDAEAVQEIIDELFNAQQKFTPFASTHEGFSILKEEVDEMWEEVKKNNLEAARKECIQVAAMALRYLVDNPGVKARRCWAFCCW